MAKHKLVTNRQSGLSTLEFTFVVPWMLLILYFIIDAGRLFYNQSILTNAAREGARYATIHAANCNCTNSTSSPPSDACQVAYNYASASLLGALTISAGMPGCSSTPAKGTLMRMQLSYTPRASFWFRINPGAKWMRSEAAMYHE